MHHPQEQSEDAMLDRPRERGQGTLETIGLMILAALMIAGIALGLSNAELSTHVKRAVCQIVTLGQGACDFPTREERVPTTPCVTGESGWSGALQISAVVTGERNATVVTEKLSNGQYRVTVTSGGALGVEGGFGGGVQVSVDDDKFGATASASGSAALEGSTSKVYVVNSAEEASNIESWAIYEQVRDVVTPDIWGVSWLLNKASDWAADQLGLTPPPEPTATVVTGGVSAEASAELTAGMDGVGVEGSGNALLGYTTYKDGSKTMTVQLGGEASASASTAETGGDSVDGGARLVAEDTFDSTGKRTGTVLKRITSVNDEMTVESYYLPIKSPQDDQVASDMMKDPTKIDDFFDYAREHGQVGKVTYDTSDGHSFAVGVDAEVIAKVGVSLEGESINTTATGAQYWDGSQWVAWDACPTTGR